MAALQNNRDRNICNATDLPSPRRFWTVIVQVLRKDDVKLGKSGKNYQGYVLADMQGTLFTAVTHEPNLSMFNRLMRPYNRYYLSNALVKDANPKYQISDYRYSWTLSGLTHVELIEDSVPYTIPCNFNFTRFSELHRLIDHDNPIAIRCLIVHSIPIGGGGAAADYVVVDEECMPMMMRVWGDFVDNGQNHVTARLPDPTMVVIVNVKVTTFHGLSLTTKNNTSVFHNPPLPNAASLLQWFDNNSEHVRTLIREEAYKNTDVLLPTPSPDMIMSVTDVLRSLDEIKAAWVSGSLQLLPAHEKLWYTACRNCNKSVSSYITWELTCTSCGARGPVQQRCHVGFYLTDNSDTMYVTIFSPDVEKLIGYTADQLKEADEKNISLLKEIEDAVYKKKVTCFVKYYDKTHRDNNMRSHPVQKMYLQPETAHDGGENVPSILVHDDSTSTAIATTQTAATDQFFSPTTKKILEEIHGYEACSVSSVPVKRSLFELKDSEQFIEPSTKAPTSVNSCEVTATVIQKVDHGASDADPRTKTAGKDKQVTEATSMIESPIKRSKNKQKEC